MEGNLRFKIVWASLIVGRKFTIFALFYFVFEGNFRVPAPGGSLYLKPSSPLFSERTRAHFLEISLSYCNL